MKHKNFHILDKLDITVSMSGYVSNKTFDIVYNSRIINENIFSNLQITL